MSKPKKGDVVVVNYTGKLKKNGGVFDSTKDKDPFEFEIGQKVVIPKFEEAVKGLEEGESTTVEIKYEDAYGEYREDLKFEFEKDKLPEEMEPSKGQTLQFKDKEGNPFYATVREIKEEKLLLDPNHPLAGKDLIFDIELVEIK